MSQKNNKKKASLHFHYGFDRWEADVSSLTCFTFIILPVHQPGSPTRHAAPTIPHPPHHLFSSLMLPSHYLPSHASLPFPSLPFLWLWWIAGYFPSRWPDNLSTFSFFSLLHVVTCLKFFPIIWELFSLNTNICCNCLSSFVFFYCCSWQIVESFCDHKCYCRSKC